MYSFNETRLSWCFKWTLTKTWVTSGDGVVIKANLTSFKTKALTLIFKVMMMKRDQLKHTGTEREVWKQVWTQYLEVRTSPCCCCWNGGATKTHWGSTAESQEVKIDEVSSWIISQMNDRETSAFHKQTVLSLFTDTACKYISSRRTEPTHKSKKGPRQGNHEVVHQRSAGGHSGSYFTQHVVGLQFTYSVMYF